MPYSLHPEAYPTEFRLLFLQLLENVQDTRVGPMTYAQAIKFRLMFYSYIKALVANPPKELAHNYLAKKYKTKIDKAQINHILSALSEQVGLFRSFYEIKVVPIGQSEAAGAKLTRHMVQAGIQFDAFFALRAGTPDGQAFTAAIGNALDGVDRSMQVDGLDTTDYNNEEFYKTVTKGAGRPKEKESTKTAVDDACKEILGFKPRSAVQTEPTQYDKLIAEMYGRAPAPDQPDGTPPSQTEEIVK
jgi:hypothetical protein